MKKMQIIILLGHTLASLNTHALAIPEGPRGIQPPKLMMSEEQLIQAIKGERVPVKRTSREIDFSTTDNVEQLQELLMARLLQDREFIQFRNSNSLDSVLTFSALALQAWNPALHGEKVKTQIVKNIIDYGYMQGFIVPTMNLIDLSYAAGKPGFGNLLNSMLADISPNLAKNFTKHYQLPTLINGQNFEQISTGGRSAMWGLLTSELGSDFYFKSSELVKSEDNGTRLNLNNLNMDSFLIQTMKSDTSYLKYYLSSIGRDNYVSNANSNNSNIRDIKNKENTILNRKGVFSNMSASEANNCFTRCLDEATERGKKYILPSGAIGAAIGGTVGFFFSGIGTIPGALGGEVIGNSVGSVLGVISGGAQCYSSKQCSDDAEPATDVDKDSNKQKEHDQKNDSQKEEAKTLKAENEKSQKELKHKEAELQKQKSELKKQQEEIKKQQEEIKKQQEEIKKQQEEIKKQQEQVKAQQEELKKQKAEAQKQADILIQQEALKKKQDELKKKEEELKKQEDDLKRKQEKNKEEQEKKKQEEDKIDATKEAESNLTRPKIQEEIGVQRSIEEIQIMKKNYSSTPMTPGDDFGVVKIFVPGDVKLIIKSVTKEVNSEDSKVNSIYPIAPGER